MTHPLVSLSLAAGVLAAATPAAAQNYPDRPIKLVVPAAAGGGGDVISRLWAEAMRTRLGPMFIENLGGADGRIGAAAVARSRPDGHTLMVSAGGPIFVVAGGQVPYDPATDFVPVTVLATTALAIMVHPSVPAHDLRELVAYAKVNSGKLSYGSAGVGRMTHLAGALLNAIAGIDILHIAYKGGGQFMPELLGGYLPMGFVNLTSNVVHLHRTGRLRMLATTGAERANVAPEIPTAAEQGFPEMVVRNFSVVFAPARTPESIVARISDATRAAMADGFREKLAAGGYEPYGDPSPTAAQHFVREEAAKWTPIVEMATAKSE
jgi:tripartite-type tricarboxylate transporter receptor subunit TctC